MRSVLLWLAMGLSGVGLMMALPGTAQAQRGRVGFHAGWHGGWRGAWHGGSYGWPGWNRGYAYPGWGWGAAYGYPAYPSLYGYSPYGYSGYGYTPSELYSYPIIDGVNAPAVPQPPAPTYGAAAQGTVAPSAEETAVRKALTANGVANDVGQLRWPLALQILGGPEIGHQADELRGQLDTLFQQAAQQASTGTVDSKLLDQIAHAVDRFHKLLIQDRQERGLLSAADYDQAERFLDRLINAESALRGGAKMRESTSR
jgi:hypothetical protein